MGWNPPKWLFIGMGMNANMLAARAAGSGDKTIGSNSSSSGRWTAANMAREMYINKRYNISY